MLNLLKRRRLPAATALSAPASVSRPCQTQETLEVAREQELTRRAMELAEQAHMHVRCPLTVEQVLPLCELTVIVHDLAAVNGRSLALPDPDVIAAIAEDLATRRFRRGYDIHSPNLVLLGALYPAVNMYGEQIGFGSFTAYTSAIVERIPEGYEDRMHALQHAKDPSLYDALSATGVQHVS